MSNQRPGAASRRFTVGETITLRSRVSIPGTKTPTDPDKVALTSLRLGTGASVLDEPLEFTRVAEGEYTLSLPTQGLSPGVYSVVVTHSDGPSKVSMEDDTFVLVAS